jgi:N utilization substance protein B
MLFQVDLTGSSAADVFAEFWTGQAAEDDVRSFAERLVHGVVDHLAFLDKVVAVSAEHWRIERMAVVDRNVLRMGVYELVYESDTPPAVVIDEAIEVAKKFGSVESGSFINGVLDDVLRRSHSGELRTPEDGPAPV